MEEKCWSLVEKERHQPKEFLRQRQAHEAETGDFETVDYCSFPLFVKRG